MRTFKSEAVAKKQEIQRERGAGVILHIIGILRPRDCRSLLVETENLAFK